MRLTSAVALLSVLVLMIYLYESRTPIASRSDRGEIRKFQDIHKLHISREDESFYAIPRIQGCHLSYAVDDSVICPKIPDIDSICKDPRDVSNFQWITCFMNLAKKYKDFYFYFVLRPWEDPYQDGKTKNIFIMQLWLDEYGIYSVNVLSSETDKSSCEKLGKAFEYNDGLRVCEFYVDGSGIVSVKEALRKFLYSGKILSRTDGYFYPQIAHVDSDRDLDCKWSCGIPINTSYTYHFSLLRKFLDDRV